MKFQFACRLGFTSPVGKGRRVAQGEGLHSIPALSPWERERTVTAAVSIVNCASDTEEGR